MSAKDAWEDKDFADRWDGRNHFRDNPDRGEQLDLLATLVAEGCGAGARVLDIGAGSGRVEDLILDRTADVQIVGVDISSAMLSLAKERLAPYGERFTAKLGAMTALDELELPREGFAFALCVQALHEVTHLEKRKVMRDIYTLLEPGGTFLLMDRVEFEGERLGGLFESVWNRLNRRAGLADPMGYAEYWDTYRKKDDHVATLEEQLAWLRAAGFRAACLYLHYNRALFAGRKPGGKAR